MATPTTKRLNDNVNGRAARRAGGRCGSCTCAASAGTSHPKWSGQCSGCGDWNTLVEDVEGSVAADVPLLPSNRPGPDAASARSGTGGRPGRHVDRRTRPCARWWARARLGHAARRRAGHRQEHAAAPAARRRGTGRRSTSPPRRAPTRSNGEPSGWARSATICGSTPRRRCRTSSRRSTTPSPNSWSSTRSRRCTTPRSASLPGSVGQVRGCAHRLVVEAKERNVAIVLVGHVTKDGGLAGPRVLEHVVDTVLQFEGDRHHALRLLRASKHRFGPTNELGLFEMCHDGLTGVPDPSTLFLADRRVGIAGSAVVPTMEGHRPIVVEVQALTDRGRARRSVAPQRAGPRRRSPLDADGGPRPARPRWRSAIRTCTRRRRAA